MMARKESWQVRSILPSELPAICRYCRVRCPDQARAVITFRVTKLVPRGIEYVLAERMAPVCVEHGVYVQQKYILGNEI